MKTVNHLGTDPIGKLVPRIAFPSMLAQFVSVLYSIVDRMYIGHIASVGDLALAGVGVCGPILTMIGAFSSLIGAGGAPLLGIRLGEKNEKEASRILANAFLMLVSLSLVLTAAALFFYPPDADGIRSQHRYVSLRQSLFCDLRFRLCVCAFIDRPEPVCDLPGLCQ